MDGVISNYPGVMSMWESTYEVKMLALPEEDDDRKQFSERLKNLLNGHIIERYTPEQLEALAKRVEPDFRKRLLFIASCIRHGLKHALGELNNTEKKAGQTWAYLMIKAYNYAGIRGLHDPNKTVKEFKKAKVPINEVWAVRQVVRFAVPEVVLLVQHMKETADKYPDAAERINDHIDKIWSAFSGAAFAGGLVFDDELDLLNRAVESEEERRKANPAEAKPELPSVAKAREAVELARTDPVAAIKEMIHLLKAANEAREARLLHENMLEELSGLIEKTGRIGEDGKLLKE